MTPEKKQAKRSCNRHFDCDRAENLWLQSHPGKEYVPASFHCHDDCCEECFGN